MILFGIRQVIFSASWMVGKASKQAFGKPSAMYFIYLLYAFYACFFFWLSSITKNKEIGLCAKNSTTL